jgi:hypothetical protein
MLRDFAFTNHRTMSGKLIAITCGLALLVTALITGCGGGGSSTPPPQSFILTASPGSVLVSQGSTSTPVQLSVQAVNGFQGTVSVSLQGLPAGATASPAFPISISSSQAITITVANTVPRGNYNLTFAGTSGALSSSAVLALTASGAAIHGPTQDLRSKSSIRS